MTGIKEIDGAWALRHPLPQPGDGGKEARGSVVIVGGGLDMAGALLLAAEAALRAGAGKLQLAAPKTAVTPLSIAMPEARVVGLPENREGRPTAKAVRTLSKSIARCDALLIGPGMMRDKEGLAEALIAHAPEAPMVLDAGALAALGQAPRGIVRILTPHAGEMARLLRRDKAQIEADPLAAALEASKRFDAITVMKGARTHVVSPDGQALLYLGGGPGLGVSGSGDVLAGLIAGLLARGAAPFQAAAAGVLLHGEAGRRLALSVGRLGFLAREISGEVPALLSQFGGAPNSPAA